MSYSRMFATYKYNFPTTSWNRVVDVKATLGTGHWVSGVNAWTSEPSITWYMGVKSPTMWESFEDPYMLAFAWTILEVVVRAHKSWMAVRETTLGSCTEHVFMFSLFCVHLLQLQDAKQKFSGRMKMKTNPVKISNRAKRPKELALQITNTFCSVVAVMHCTTSVGQY